MAPSPVELPRTIQSQHSTVWATPEQAEAIRRYLKGEEPLSDIQTRACSSPVARTTRPRRRKPADSRLERNLAIVEPIRTELDARRGAGEKPSTLAAELRDRFDFDGTGATLNGLMGWWGSARQSPSKESDTQSAENSNN